MHPTNASRPDSIFYIYLIPLEFYGSCRVPSRQNLIFHLSDYAVHIIASSFAVNSHFISVAIAVRCLFGISGKKRVLDSGFSAA